MSIFDQNLVIDESAFDDAVRDFNAISQDIEALRNEVNRLLDDLAEGFDTPAGRKFYKSCSSSLLSPLNDQANVVRHVAENLNLAREEYQSVFEEYRALNNAIDSIDS